MTSLPMTMPPSIRLQIANCRLQIENLECAVFQSAICNLQLFGFVPQQPPEVEALAALEQLLPRLRLLAEAVQADEALGGLVVELVAGLVGGQLFAVQAVLALAAHDRGLPLEQLDPRHAADEPL